LKKYTTMNATWTGVYPALTTKLTADDQLDLKTTAHNLEEQIKAGMDGFILGGSLGEASTLTWAEKETLTKFTLEQVNGRVPVVLNIAEGSTAEAIKQAKAAESWGANGLMLLPPMRYKSDHRETVAFLKSVAASTSLPVMIYNNPVDYKTEITLDMFEELAELENINAIKESTREISNVTRLINRFGDRFKISCGVDTIATEALLMGAHGWVGGLVCAFPAETVAIYRLIKAGRRQQALDIHRWFLPLLELDLHPKLVQYIKLAEQFTGLGTEFVRAPRLTLVGEERAAIIKVIEDGIAARPTLPDYLSLKVENDAQVSLAV
jgi:dihydrodipicolinate synthase/N-acetylneuraminate lyase